MTQKDLEQKIAGACEFKQALTEAAVDALMAHIETEDQRNKVWVSLMDGSATLSIDTLKTSFVRYVRELKKQLTPVFCDISEAGDYMTIQEFIDAVKDKAFVDSDGFGYYCDGRLESNITVYPSYVEDGDWDKRFTHVTWFNK